jgi:isoleucyl-tRNA synthetase
MPFAQWGWPHRGHDDFRIAFPADFISEAVDQTRGWFYSLLMISTLLFGDQSDGSARPLPHPFKTCIVLGHVTDKHGKKESKSKGNYTPPDRILDTDGADAMRWYFYASNPPWNSTRYSPENVRLGQQEFLVKLRNVYSFFTIYANIDGFDPRTSPRRPVPQRSTLDRWMSSEFHRALRDVTQMMDGWKLYDAAQRIIALTDALSNWYVRRSRDRFWAGANAAPEVVADKWDAYHTLYEVLVGMSQLAAPFVPFISDVLWQNLVRRPYPDAPESVHLSDWPAFDEALIDESLAEDMAAIRDIVGLGLQARNANRLKVRQPLHKVEVILGHPHLTDRIASYTALITDELNVKEVAFTQDAAHVSFQLKPNFRALGPIYGARVQLVKSALNAIDPKVARQAIAVAGALELALDDGTTATMSPDLVSVSVTPAEGFVASAGPVGVVILETALSPELVAEGLAREVLSRIQTWRKQADLDYTARIRVTLEGDPELLDAVRAHADFICNESLADALSFGTATGDEKREENIDGRALTLGLSRA